ncbi:MAG: hypothetical protein M3R25_15670 [Bacteroidota bacterium]|nr:hypothetical protein [Bacteroidota bacterium]
MSANREKSTRIMGFVVSILLHGIFFAGCIALDNSHKSETVAQPDQTQIDESATIAGAHKEKS